jgi:multiple sugar transport system substrate-binding protein
MCAEEIPLAAVTCEYCGARFEVTSTGYCQNCHEVREADGNGQCKVCGNKVVDLRVESRFVEEPIGQVASVTHTTPVSSVPPIQKSRTGSWMVVGALILLIIFAAIGTALWSQHNSPISLTTPTSTITTPLATSTITLTPEPVQIRWMVASNDPTQIAADKKVVKDFNASHPGIILMLEVVPDDSIIKTLTTEFGAGNAPDLIGPRGREFISTFSGQWLDLTPYVQTTGFDTSIFDPALVASYHTDEGQIALPFMVYPAAVFYQRDIFDKAGLNYPPAVYGRPYTWPDGTTEEWNYETLAKVARLLTIDENGRNATQSGFAHDQQRIVQFGYIQQWTTANKTGTLWGADKAYQGEPGKYQAVIPEQWKDAWRWYYDSVWGPQLFIPSYWVIGNSELGSGNPFNGGRVAMANANSWYTCCLGEAGKNWDLAVLPSYNGAVHGSVDTDTFLIWKGTKYPEQTFEVLAYLIGPASQDLQVSYIGLPGKKSDQEIYISMLSNKFPWVTNWEAFRSGLAYLDIPSQEGYMPNFQESMERIQEFHNLMLDNDKLNLDAEINKLEDDLQIIFKR